MAISPLETSSFVLGDVVPIPTFPPELNILLSSITHDVPSQKVVLPIAVPFGKSPSFPETP